MDVFLQKHPEYREEAEFLGMIKERRVHCAVGKIKDRCSVLDIDGLKELLEEESPANKEAIRTALRRIAASEAKGMEKMVYQALTHKPVVFTDIRTKIMFYEEIWALRRYFRNGTEEPSFIMAELLYLRVYHHKDISKHFAKYMAGLPFLDKVFYFALFAGLIRSEVAVDLVRDIDAGGICGPSIDYRLMVISSLPEDLYHKSLAAHLLYSPQADKLKIVRHIGRTLDAEKLSLAVLDECFSSTIGIESFYLEYLRIMDMFALSREHKIKLLYAWMRYFLVQGMTEHFRLLLERIELKERGDAELGFYRAFREHLDGKRDLKSVAALAKRLKDENGYARHSLEQVIDVYAHK